MVNNPLGSSLDKINSNIGEQMFEEHNEDKTVQDSVRKMFLASIPERQNELDEFWSKFNMTFQNHSDNHTDGKFIFDAGMYRFIRFNHRVLRTFWIGTFAAMAGYEAINTEQNKKIEDFIDKRDSILDLFDSKKISLVSTESELHVLLEELQEELADFSSADFVNFEQLICAFENTAKDEVPDEKPLPIGIPEPGTMPDSKIEPVKRATAELAIIAAAWAFLHEVRHIIHQQEGTSYDMNEFTQEQAHNEEFSCDEFATKFILDHIDNYCEESMYDRVLVSRKRRLSIYCALFSVTMLGKNNWVFSKSHPSLQDRINKVKALMKEPDDEVLEYIVETMFKSIARIWPTVPTVKF